MPLPLWKRAALVPFLLFALWLLTDNDTSDSDEFTPQHQRRHHLAVLTALQRHPPCLRVYRSLLELNLLLWGAVASLWLWNRTIGKKMIGHLLFQRINSISVGEDEGGNDDARYLPIDEDDFSPLHAEDILMLGKKPEEREATLGILSRNTNNNTSTKEAANDADMMNDANYESDGEVSELTISMLPTPYDPPEVAVVAAAAVDSLVCILLSLFFFTLSSAEGGRYVDGMEDIGFVRVVALVAAPLFPLVLFLAGVVWAIVPWKGQRSEFWKIVSLTIGAPMYHVTFRDGFIGDIFTSMVRPMRDIAFTFFYLFSGLQGWWKQSYDLDNADLPLETNWILHTVIFPMCTVSPLWWRFMQNLRQTYEHKKRWPYLGNALKYFVAAEVAMFGVFNPSRTQTVLWLSCFVLATLYQIWWDVVMDWELLVVEGNGKVRLRRTRIYSVPWMYWTILVINVILRFGWTLSFLPPHYLNRAGVLSKQFEGDLSHILNPAIAVAEIIRRTLWGFLRVELEAIKVGRREPTLKGAWSDRDNETADSADLELKVMAMEGIDPTTSAGVRWEDELMIPNGSTKPGWIMMITSDMYMMSELQILGELCLYSTAFTALGLIAAAHRLTY